MKRDLRFKATMYMLDASVSSDTPIHDLLEGFGKQVLSEQQTELAEVRALLARLCDREDAYLEATAFLERTR